MNIGKGKTSTNRIRVKSVVTYKDNHGHYHIKAKTSSNLWYEYKHYHTEIEEITRIVGSTLRNYINPRLWNLIRTDEDRENDIFSDIDSLIDDLKEMRLLFDDNEYPTDRVRQKVYDTYDKCFNKMNLQVDIIHDIQEELNGHN